MQVRGDAGLDQEHVLAERPEVGVDRVEREHRPHPRLEGRVAHPGSGGPGSGKPSCTVEIPMPWWWALIRPGSTSMPSPPISSRARVVAAERRRGRRPQRWLRRRSGRRRPRAAAASAEASRMSPETSSSVMPGTLSAGASVPPWTRRATARRSRSGRISSDPSAASRSLARCGWSASSALGSPGCRSTCTPSTRRTGSRAPSSSHATARGTTRARASCSRPRA